MNIWHRRLAFAAFLRLSFIVTAFASIILLVVLETFWKKLFWTWFVDASFLSFPFFFLIFSFLVGGARCFHIVKCCSFFFFCSGSQNLWQLTTRCNGPLVRLCFHWQNVYVEEGGVKKLNFIMTLCNRTIVRNGAIVGCTFSDSALSGKCDVGVDKEQPPKYKQKNRNHPVVKKKKIRCTV